MTDKPVHGIQFLAIDTDTNKPTRDGFSLVCTDGITFEIQTDKNIILKDIKLLS